MKISVIIPAYNEEKYLGNCLTSLKNQVELADEIIVVDNNSTDKTVEIAKSYGARVVTESKQGISYTRNAGFDAAQYDIIARCDADTEVPTDWIKRIKENFTENKIDALTGPVDYYDIHIGTLPSMIFVKISQLIQKDAPIMFGFNTVLTKKMWAQVRGEVCMNNHKVHEDFDLAIHIAKVGGTIRYDKELVVRSSGRRILKNPYSFFIEYPIRLWSTYHSH